MDLNTDTESHVVRRVNDVTGKVSLFIPFETNKTFGGGRYP